MDLADRVTVKGLKVLGGLEGPEALELRPGPAERENPTVPGAAAPPPDPAEAMPVPTSGGRSPPAPSTSPAG